MIFALETCLANMLQGTTLLAKIAESAWLEP